MLKFGQDVRKGGTHNFGNRFSKIHLSGKVTLASPKSPTVNYLLRKLSQILRCNAEIWTGHKAGDTGNFGIAYRLTSQCQGHISLLSGSNGQLSLKPLLHHN